MTRQENRFTVSYVQADINETIVILKDKETNTEYLEIITEKGIALTAMQPKAV